jgi:hypothetical protein
MRFFHGTTATLTDTNLSDGLCLAYDEGISEAYLHGQTGRIYTVEVAAVAMADHEELEAVADQLGITDWRDFGGHFVLADNADVRAALAEQGFGAVEYTDQVADADYEAQTVRLLGSGLARITDVQGCF